MKIQVFVFVMAIGVIAGLSVVPVASAELSQGFRNKLQQQFESGNIPDPDRNMSYEERLAVRKKQQKLEEEKQKNGAVRPSQSPPPRRDDGYDRRDERQRSDDRYFDPYEQSYRDCQRRWNPGSGDFSRCMRDSRERSREDRYDNRYDDNRGYDGRSRRY